MFKSSSYEPGGRAFESLRARQNQCSRSARICSLRGMTERCYRYLCLQHHWVPWIPSTTTTTAK